MEHHNRIGRNEKCPCGSGKKFKKCHLPRVEDELMRKRDEEASEEMLWEDIFVNMFIQKKKHIYIYIYIYRSNGFDCLMKVTTVNKLKINTNMILSLYIEIKTYNLGDT